MNPTKFCVKFKPPRLCLIYELNREEFFHEFFLSAEDLEMPTKKLIHTLKKTHQGYLDQIESSQIEGLIERIKTESMKKVEKQAPRGNKKLESLNKPEEKFNPAPNVAPKKKASAVDKFKNILDNIGIYVDNNSSDSSSSEGQVDFNAVEESFQNEVDSDY